MNKRIRVRDYDFEDASKYISQQDKQEADAKRKKTFILHMPSIVNPILNYYVKFDEDGRYISSGHYDYYPAGRDVDPTRLDTKGHSTWQYSRNEPHIFV